MLPAARGAEAPVASGVDTAARADASKPLVPELKDDGTFTYGTFLSGKIVGGEGYGIELVKGAVPAHHPDLPVTRAQCLSLQSYFVASNLNGVQVPRKAELEFDWIDGNTVRVQIPSWQNWRVDTDIRYRLLPDCVIEAQYTFTFKRDYPRFEAFVINPFFGCAPPWLKLAGKWQQGEAKAQNECRFWCSNPQAAEALGKEMERWRSLYREQHEGREVFAGVADGRPFTEPIMITSVHGTGYGVVHWIDPASCASLSTDANSTQSFGLIGRDVKKGERITCRAWMVYRKINPENLDEVLTYMKTQKPTIPELPPPPGRGRNLVWHDEFDGGKLDVTKWDYRGLGPRRRAINVKEAISLDGEGHLRITTFKKDGKWCTGMIGTQGKFERAFGYYECRVKFQTQPGHWSAFWLQSPTFGDPVGKPEEAGVEVDILEYYSTRPDKLDHTLHWDGYGQDHKVASKSAVVNGLDEGWHVVGVDWKPDAYVFYIDGRETARLSYPVSKRPEYIILSLEVDPLAGNITKGKFPDSVLFDYVRVYQVRPRSVEDDF